MDYATMRARACDGDVLLVEGCGWISRAIRVLTGQQISHVAILVWVGEGLWVAEMRELRGYVLTPASLWTHDRLKGGDYLYYGVAPDIVRRCPRVRHHVLAQRQARYGYGSLLRIWWAQLTRRTAPDDRMVCSTFVQRVWAECGHALAWAADPGDFLREVAGSWRLRG